MRPLYYRDLNPSHFFSETDFNLSSEHVFETKIIDTQFDDDNEIKFIEVELNYTNSNHLNLFKDSNCITDVRVIVGKNGVGKSTLINKMFKLISTTNISLSYEVIIGNDFIIIGDKIKLKIADDIKEKILANFPNIKLWVANSSLKNAHMFGTNEMIGFGKGSFIQQRKKGAILYYSDTLEIHNLNSYGGQIYTSEETREEGQRLIDLTTLNRIVISNKWGLKSILKDSIFVNSLIAYQNYETIHFLDEYFDNKIIEKLTDKHIFERIEINFQFGGLIDAFVNYINNSMDTNKYIENYPVLQYITGRFNGDSVLFLYRELLLSIVLLELDELVGRGLGLVESIERVISDFTDIINHLDNIFDHKEIIRDDKFKEIILTYINSSLEHSKYAEIYKVIDENICPYFHSESKIKNQLKVNGLESVGITLNLKKDHEVIEQIKRQLIQLKEAKLEIPFLQMKIDKLSAGETSYISMVTRMLSAFNYTDQSGTDIKEICLILDEPGNSFHPDWQKRFIHNLNKFLELYNSTVNNIKVNIIITTHSPFILSDFSNGHILKLDRASKKTIIKPNESSSFGANIHDLLANDFFLRDGFMGEFAKETIQGLIRDLNSSKDFSEEEQNTIWDTIELIGEDILRNSLIAMYQKKFKKPNYKELLDFYNKNQNGAN